MLMFSEICNISNYRHQIVNVELLLGRNIFRPVAVNETCLKQDAASLWSWLAIKITLVLQVTNKNESHHVKRKLYIYLYLSRVRMGMWVSVTPRFCTSKWENKCHYKKPFRFHCFVYCYQSNAHTAHWQFFYWWQLTIQGSEICTSFPWFTPSLANVTLRGKGRGGFCFGNCSGKHVQLEKSHQFDSHQIWVPGVRTAAPDTPSRFDSHSKKMSPVYKSRRDNLLYLNT